MDTATEPLPGEVGLRERKKQRQRQDIVQQTVDSVRTHGYEATTVAVVASALEISSATFYNYFRSKEDVLAYWVQMVWERITRDVLAGQKSSQTIPEVLYALNSRVAALLESDRDLWCAIASTNAWYPAENNSLAGTEAAAHKALTELVRLGQDRGELTSRVDAEMVARLLDGTLVTACSAWALDQTGHCSLIESLNVSLDLFLTGATDRHSTNATKRRRVWK